MEYLNGGNSEPAASFSWKRVGQLAQFYKPAFSRQMIVFGAASILAVILTLLPFHGVVQVGIFSIVWTALQLIFELSPIVLCKSGDSRIVERLIPASAAEKFVFRIIYFLVIIPAIVLILPEAATYVYSVWPAVQRPEMLDIIKIHLELPLLLRCVNILGGAGAVLTCLYFVTKPRTGRFLKGFISVFLFQFILGLIGALWGVVWAFSKGFNDGVCGRTSNPPSAEELSRQGLESLSNMSGFSGVLSIVLAIYVGLMLYLNYKALRHSNL